MTEEQYEKLNRLAEEVLRLSRNTLLVNLRFLDAALSRFQLFPTDKTDFATDGERLLYTPLHILERYKNEKEASVHDYLHAVLHCVFRHMYVHTLVDQACWNLACDVAVEYTIHSLGLRSAKINREILQEEVFSRLEKKGLTMTAEKLYRYFLDEKMTSQKLAELRGIFMADSHDIWYMSDEEKQETFGFGGGDGNSNGEDGGNDGDGENSEYTSVTVYVSAAEQDWKNIAENMQMEMETFAKLQGDQAGGLIQNLKEVNRERYDYTAFLKKFAVMGEAMKINDDEFDYIFYTYGLKLYKKVPLVEPLEYKDVKRIKEFVIAIDTSGSTSGELVQKFIQKTYNILMSTESFFSKINLHIIQCDATIQEDAVIHSQEEFDRYLEQMKIHGLGGTDFRPVFSYVDWLIEKHEFVNLKGLIYFTDGYGTFPAVKPAYDTAFVFVEEGYNNPDVPPWAIKLVLQKDEI